MLAPSTLVVARADALLIHDATATIRVDLTRAADPHTVADIAWEGPAALAGLGFLSAAQAARLDRRLSAHGIGSDAPRPHDLPTRVVPLRAAVTAFAASGAAPRGVLAVTATEALWLPPDCPATTGERALRLFVSRMSDRIRLCAYGRLLSGRRGLAIAGDLPDPQRLRPVAILARQTAEVRTWSWERGEVAQTSERLSPTEVTAIDQWWLDDGTAVYFACGSYAWPHLAALDPFAAPAVGRCAAADTDPSLARVKCAAKGLERFAIGDLPPGALHLAPASRLPGPWLDPHEVVSCAAEHRDRLDLNVFDPTRPEWWVTGHRPGGAPIWLPAALVYSPFPDAPAWLRHGHITSVGTAAHPDPEQAVLRAWLESVAREALQRSRGVSVELESVPPSLGPLIRCVQARADLCVVLLEGAHGIPVVAAAGAGEHGLAFGLCAAGDPVAAARQALLKACAALRFPFLSEPRPAALGRLPGGPAVDWPDRPAMRVRIPDEVAIYRFPSRFLDGLTVARVLDPLA